MNARELSPTERRLLAYLEAAGGRVCTKQELCEHGYGGPFNGTTRRLDGNAARLRALGYPIVNVWGVGYKLEPEPSVCGGTGRHAGGGSCDECDPTVSA